MADLDDKLARLFDAVDDNRKVASDLVTTVRVMQVDVGYLKKQVEKNVADDERRKEVERLEAEAKANAKTGRVFTAVIAVFSALLGIVATGVKALIEGGGNAGH